MRSRILATISIGLLSAACQGSYSQNGTTAIAPAYGGPSQSSSQVCADYGFRSGTAGFNQCVSREQSARAAGRVNRDYAPARLTADAQAACNSYGLNAGTVGYDRCVSREVEARSYIGAGSAQGYRVDQAGYRIDAEGYRIDANGYRIATQTPAQLPMSYAYSTTPVSRDEYGNLYDAQGHRVDSRGRVIAQNRY